ncbi:MAG: hypothetical protein KDK64_05475 [Chlamydiia bacterium]|nr:hypothetical protein [Chlamydiia bacterium]
MKKEDLIGKWKIQREISALDGTSKGKMWGSGFFDLYEGNQLLYQEHLYHETEHDELLTATKFYRYHFSAEAISIYFYREEEGRLFMTLPIKTPVLKGNSKCGEDGYSLQWTWVNEETFLTRYQIIGPKKQMMIESEFRR